jgi:hypothetical protein
MSDSADVMAVLGAIDREVTRLDGDARDVARGRIAELIPPYADPDAVGWYDRLLDASGGSAGAADLDEALERLARPAGDVHALPRRVAALGAAARAFPDAYGPQGAKRDVMLRALAAPGVLVAADGDDARGDPEQGLRLLAEPPPDDPSFAALRVAGRDVFSDLVLSQAPPFRGQLVNPDKPEIALTTRHRVRGMTLDDARRGFLDPANWKNVEGWCGMTPSDPPPNDPHVQKRFLEEVAMGECEGDLAIRVWLDFPPVRQLEDHEGDPVELVLAYDMSKEQPLPANDAVRTDQGSIRVRDKHDHLAVTATKRIGFGPSLPGGRSLAWLALPAGYTELGAAFIVGASGGLGKQITVKEGG